MTNSVDVMLGNGGPPTLSLRDLHNTNIELNKVVLWEVYPNQSSYIQFLLLYAFPKDTTRTPSIFWSFKLYALRTCSKSAAGFTVYSCCLWKISGDYDMLKYKTIGISC